MPTRHELLTALVSLQRLPLHLDFSARRSTTARSLDPVVGFELKRQREGSIRFPMPIVTRPFVSRYMKATSPSWRPMKRYQADCAAACLRSPPASTAGSLGSARGASTARLRRGTADLFEVTFERSFGAGHGARQPTGRSPRLRRVRLRWQRWPPTRSAAPRRLTPSWIS
jgi:hypothetical protein